MPDEQEQEELICCAECERIFALEFANCYGVTRAGWWYCSKECADASEED